VAPQEHDYSVIGGMNRAKVGRMLTIVASAISAGLVFALLAAVDLALKLGWNVNAPPMLLSLLGAGAVFAGLYFVLNHWAWKWPGISNLLKVPDLSGTWSCQGRTLDAEGKTRYEWQASITVVQYWDKLRIRLSTQNSGSSSMSAALAHDSVDGYVLLYHYRNDPKPCAVGLASHTGCAVMTIAKDAKSASGEYFNGRGRMSFGTMNWTREI
jgi:hypothetical protein